MNLAEWFAQKGVTWSVEDPEEEDAGPDIESVVQVTFSRPLTWAEREYFYGWFRYCDEVIGWIFKGEGRILIISSTIDSRDIVADISRFVATEYLNVFPRAVKTIYPEVKV